MKNEHLLICPVLIEGQAINLKIEQVLNGNIEEKIQVLRKLQENYAKLTKYHDSLKNTEQREQGKKQSET